MLSRPTGGRLHHPQARQSLPHWPLQIHLQVQGSVDTSVFFSSNTQHPDLCGWPGTLSGSAGRNWTSTRLPLRNLGRGQVPTPNILPCNPAQSSSAHRHTHTNAIPGNWLALAPQYLGSGLDHSPTGCVDLSPRPPVVVRRSL